MTKDELLTKLIKIHVRYSGWRSSETAQMCTLWSTDDPPDVLEDTEPFDDICDLINYRIDEDYALELYEMTIGEAAQSLYDFIAAIEEDD